VVQPAPGGWTADVAIGLQGFVLFQLVNGSPIVDVQVRLGTQVAGEQLGQDLRASAGQYFSVPRTPGTYALTVYAKDSQGCEAVTTAPRTVTVH
jgi:hypothetical protein